MMNIVSTRLKLKSKRGNALVMVLLLFMVMAIFSTALLSVAYTNGNLVMAQEKTDKAYYVARSVTEATANWISKNYYDYDNWYDVVPYADELTRGNARITPGNLDGQAYTLEVWRTDSNTIVVSTAVTYQGFTANSVVRIDMDISANAIFDYAVYSMELFEVDGTMNIINSGNAGTNADKPAKNFKDFNYFPTTHFSEFSLNNSFDAIDIEDYSPETAALTPTVPVFDVNGIITVTGDTRFEELDLSDKTMVIENFDTATNAKRDVIIYISGKDDGSGGAFTVGGSQGSTIRVTEPDISKGGKVFIIVDALFESSSNNNKFTIEGIMYQEPIVYLFVNTTGLIDTRGGTWNLNAFVYMPFSEFKNSGGLYLNGALISFLTRMNGNNDVYFFPPTELLDTPLGSMIRDNRIISIEQTTWLP